MSLEFPWQPWPTTQKMDSYVYLEVISLDRLVLLEEAFVRQDRKITKKYTHTNIYDWHDKGMSKYKNVEVFVHTSIDIDQKTQWELVAWYNFQRLILNGLLSSTINTLITFTLFLDYNIIIPLTNCLSLI